MTVADQIHADYSFFFFLSLFFAACIKLLLAYTHHHLFPDPKYFSNFTESHSPFSVCVNSLWTLSETTQEQTSFSGVWRR